jgi:hypothetical protein
MDPIRPIGPRERDVEPVVRVTRSSPDAQRERRDPREEEPREEPRKEFDQPQPPPPGEDGGSLIDVRV